MARRASKNQQDVKQIGEQWSVNPCSAWGGGCNIVILFYQSFSYRPTSAAATVCFGTTHLASVSDSRSSIGCRHLGVLCAGAWQMSVMLSLCPRLY